MNTKQQAVWTTEKLIGKDVWLEWEAFQITQADAISKRNNGTTDSRAQARQLRGMLRGMDQDEREKYFRETQASSALDEVESVD